jgi:hypothetical protein
VRNVDADADDVDEKTMATVLNAFVPRHLMPGLCRYTCETGRGHMQRRSTTTSCYTQPGPFRALTTLHDSRIFAAQPGSGGQHALARNTCKVAEPGYFERFTLPRYARNALGEGVSPIWRIGEVPQVQPRASSLTRSGQKIGEPIDSDSAL